jgi:hypothetical protein
VSDQVVWVLLRRVWSLVVVKPDTSSGGIVPDFGSIGVGFLGGGSWLGRGEVLASDTGTLLPLLTGA